ncbi:cuticle protein 10.9 [Trichonephila inaurata madagascariensis]|uniref:Cuticle protein 10.9 n=1 Tax=Trichonephila inaurata madagascariensis TaxID=2747483 RepID=A0A8X6X1Q9_9ARAC|nr:cuticle protein 10.9 [Trichonephila inaurata madagascariensis]
MISVLLLCFAASTLAQQSTTQYSTTNSQIESEGNALSTLGQTYSRYQPAAQQRRPVYTVPESYSYMPYSFNYVANGEDGSSSRQETGDASGRVVGSYTIAVEDGRRRVVDYVADQNGFRATIDTNEPGTDVQNPADVVFHSAGLDSRTQQSAYRPANAFRPRPSRLYTQPAAYNPVVYRGDAHAPYTHYGGHLNDPHRHSGHAYASYYNNDHGYYWH